MFPQLSICTFAKVASCPTTPSLALTITIRQTRQTASKWKPEHSGCVGESSGVEGLMSQRRCTHISKFIIFLLFFLLNFVFTFSVNFSIRGRTGGSFWCRYKSHLLKNQTKYTVQLHLSCSSIHVAYLYLTRVTYKWHIYTLKCHTLWIQFTTMPSVPTMQTVN